MSNQGFKNVPGVPDGWELVRFDYAVDGESYLTGSGEIVVHLSTKPTQAMRLIIRKIEVPKRYRPFANGAEYMASPRRGVAADWKTNESDAGFFAVVSVNASFVWVAHGEVVERFYWREAFEKLVCRHADGSASPFGVEVTE
jgi:hypothetical protein